MILGMDCRTEKNSPLGGSKLAVGAERDGENQADEEGSDVGERGGCRQCHQFRTRFDFTNKRVIANLLVADTLTSPPNQRY
jgi:hypothetical protein